MLHSLLEVYVDKVLMGYGLDGTYPGFKLVPGVTVETTSTYSSYPSINVGDCIEVRGTWITTDSPPVYLGNPGTYINKIICSTNHPPTVPTKPSGSKSGYSGTLYSYSTSAKDIDKDQVKYVFDWGDDTTTETAFVKSGNRASASHTWSDAGTYLVKAIAIDSKGASSESSSSLTVTIAVNNPPDTPTLPTGPNTGKIRKPYTYTTSASDPDRDAMKYTFDWGDGTTSVTGSVNSGAIARGSHKWRTSGTYQVRAIAKDRKGASSLSWSNPFTLIIT
jgi:hypothetical protein